MNPENDELLPRNSGEKTRRIDLGLAVLSAVTPPRAALSTEDIASWCDCSPAMITAIEARALRRLRERVREKFRLSQLDGAELQKFLALHFQS